jgi:hypothetical protein
MELNKTGNDNVAIGTEALFGGESGFDDSAVGYKALSADKAGKFDSAFGQGALEHSTASNDTAVGGGALQHDGEGEFNTALGDSALISNVTGKDDVAIGSDAGSQVAGGDNIDISNVGTSTDAGDTRIGTEGSQTKAYVAGIAKTEVKGCTVQVTSEGQLGCNPHVEAPKGLKICVPEKAGGTIKIPPCKKGYKETEVAEL